MIIWLASYPKSGNTWLRILIISVNLMDNKTNLIFIKFKKNK